MGPKLDGEGQEASGGWSACLRVGLLTCRDLRGNPQTHERTKAVQVADVLPALRSGVEKGKGYGLPYGRTHNPGLQSEATTIHTPCQGALVFRHSDQSVPGEITGGAHRSNPAAQSPPFRSLTLSLVTQVHSTLTPTMKVEKADLI